MPGPPGAFQASLRTCAAGAGVVANRVNNTVCIGGGWAIGARVTSKCFNPAEA